MMVNGESPSVPPGAEGGKRSSWPFWVAQALILGLWLASFYPVLIERKSISIGALLEPLTTGASGPAIKRSRLGPLKSKDASFMQVHLPTQAFLAHHGKLGHYPQWNPLVGLGQPVSSDPLYKPTDPFFWPFFFSPSAWSFSLGIVLTALAGAVGWALFLKTLGLCDEAVVLGAALFAVNPLTSQSLVFSNAWGAWMAGWGFLGIEWWLSGRRWGLSFAAAACALMVYCGHPLICFLYMAAILAYLLIREGDQPWHARSMAALALIGALAALTAVHTLPLLRGMALYESYKALWDGGPFHALAELVDPRSPVYIPACYLVLAIIGLLGTSGKRLRVFAALMALYGLVLMLPGIGGAPHWVLSFGGLVVGQYGEELVWLGLLILMALGMDRLAREKGRNLKLALLASVGLALLALSAWRFSYSVGSLYWRDHFLWTPVPEIGRCFLLILLCLLVRPRRILALVTAVVVAALPLTLPFTVSRFFSDGDILLEPPPIVKRLVVRSKEDPRWRISGSLPLHASLPVLMPNQAAMWGLADLRLCHPLMLSTYVTIAQPWNRASIFGTMELFPRQNEEALAFFGVRWFLDDASHLQLCLPVVERVGNLALQEVPDAVPWARLVDSWEVGANRGDEFRRTVAHIRTSEWRRRVVLDRAPVWAGTTASPAPSASGLVWLGGGDDAWSWKVKASRPTVLVALMNAHPDWAARVDGQPAPLLRAYGAFMGVALSPGEHLVELAFRDRWLVAGAWITGLAWCALAFWAYWTHIRRPVGRPRF